MTNWKEIEELLNQREQKLLEFSKILNTKERLLNKREQDLISLEEKLSKHQDLLIKAQAMIEEFSNGNN